MKEFGGSQHEVRIEKKKRIMEKDWEIIFCLLKKPKDKGYLHYKKGWEWVNNNFTLITIQIIIYSCIVSQILTFFQHRLEYGILIVAAVNMFTIRAEHLAALISILDII